MCFNERVRIDGVSIQNELVVHYTSILRNMIEQTSATFFEATTAMAFKYFADENIDIAVIETGMGGRLDATNVIYPEMAIITNVALEHTEHLGFTLKEIATEKAGIIKEGIECLSGVQDMCVQSIFMKIAEERNARMIVCDLSRIRTTFIPDFDRMNLNLLIEGISEEYQLGLIGYHQIQNALLAFDAVRTLMKNGWGKITGASIHSGFRDVKRLSGLRGRLDRISTDKEVIVDVAHNPHGFHAMLQTFCQLRNSSTTHLVFGLLATKDASAIVRVISEWNWRSVTLVKSSTHEAQDTDAIARELVKQDLTFTVFPSVAEGMKYEMERCRFGETILLCGSHYIVGDYLATVEEFSSDA